VICCPRSFAKKWVQYIRRIVDLRISYKTYLFLMAIALLIVPPVIDVVNGAAKAKSSCSVSLVMDGDTVKIDCPESGIRSARIIGYDTPEKNARCIGEFIKATRATWTLRIMLWQARTIEIRLNGKDRYDRFLTVLRVNGKDVAPRMISTGLARSYSGGRRGSWCS